MFAFYIFYCLTECVFQFQGKAGAKGPVGDSGLKGPKVWRISQVSNLAGDYIFSRFILDNINVKRASLLASLLYFANNYQSRVPVFSLEILCYLFDGLRIILWHFVKFLLENRKILCAKKQKLILLSILLPSNIVIGSLLSFDLCVLSCIFLVLIEHACFLVDRETKEPLVPQDALEKPEQL